MLGEETVIAYFCNGYYKVKNKKLAFVTDVKKGEW